MPDFPYVLTSSKAPQLFEAIRNRGRPDKVHRGWLEGAGFKSKNDRAFVKLLKFVGVVADSGVPTESYDLLKNPEWETNLGHLIKASYSDIFSDYPNAQSRTKQQLVDQMRPIDSGASSNVLELKATTFLNICEVANFAEDAVGQVGDASGVTRSEPQPDRDLDHGSSEQNITVNVNISLEIPTVADEAVYDALFSSMSRHIGSLLNAQKAD